MTTLVMAACGGSDYEDWADPQWNPQEDAITIPGFKASAVGAQDLNTITEETVPVFTLSTATLPAGYSLTDARIELTPTGDGVVTEGTTTLNATTEGVVTKADLQALIEKSFGKNPVARTFKAHVYVSAIKDGQAAFIDAGEIEVVATPVKPDISSAYYVLGGTKGWDVAGAQSQKFDHSETNVYDDPVFTITIPAAAGSDTWFAIAPEEALADGNVDWSKVLGTKKGNGLNAVGETEQLDYRSNLSDDGSFKVAADLGAKFIRITINMLDFSYKIDALSFEQFFYEIGNESKWDTSHALYGAAGDGKYEGWYYLNGEFKFKPNKDNWDGDYEFDGEGKIADNGGSNCPDPGAGFYRINVDLQALTYSLTKVSSLSLIGTVKGNWDTDVDLTYNNADGAWEYTGDLAAGEFKIRMNHDWTTSWGGTTSGTDYSNLTYNNGQNLTLAASGNYTIKFYLSYEGNNKVVITKN